MGKTIRLSSVQDLLQDVRYALRTLQKAPGFTAAAVIALTFGIGVNNTVFTLVNAILIRSLPFDNPDRIVAIGTGSIRNPAAPGPPGYRGLSYPEYQDWKTGTRAFSGMAAYAETTMNLSEEGQVPERFFGAYISANALA